ncbi:MAG: hypothetical protein JNN11_05100 [Candidatus Doudnabacteria bacterium]|nr:hypothetical protein [Candidatus Doudnabacteria bacterium]
MKQKLSSQTSSFIILTSLAFIGGLFVILSSQNLKNSNLTYIVTGSSKNGAPSPVSTAYAAETRPLPDTSSWQTHDLGTFGLNFKIPSSWKVKPAKKSGQYQIVEIDPGKKFYNIKIYVSENNYYVMEGLPAVTTTIGGVPALNVSNLLYGLNTNNTYFTFDLGPSLSLMPEFNAMIASIQISQ